MSPFRSSRSLRPSSRPGCRARFLDRASCQSRPGPGRILLPACLALFSPGGLAGQSPSTAVERLLRELDDPRSTYVFVAAHRGGWERDWQNRAPENSLANLEKAVRMKFDFYETDIRESADSVLVIMHDVTVDRTTNGTGRVTDLTLARLKQLRLKYANGRVSREPVPTLEEFLVRGRGRILFKADYQADLETLPRAVRLLQEHGMLGQVIFRFTWSEETAETLRQLVEAGMPYHPNLVMFRTRDADEVRAAVAQFAPRTIEIEEQGGILGLGRKIAHRLRLAPIEAWLDRGGLSAEAAEAVQVAREAGLVIGIPSTGGPGEWRRLIEQGFRIFHTRQPERMTRWLREQGLHP